MLFKTNSKIVVIILTVSLLFAVLPGCTASGMQSQSPPAVPETTQSSITVAFAGDIMTHGPQIRAALNAKTGTYDFNPVFKPMAKMISSADFAFGNLETTCSGKDRGGFTGYPTFNSPESLIPALKNAGFDVLTTANNHCMDRGFYGIQKTIENINKNSLKHTGTFADSSRKDSILYLQKNNIKLAVIACTYATNGITVPQGKEFAVNMIDLVKLSADIAAAKENGADFVAVVIHFGNEYQRQPSDMQKSTAQALADAGADLIIGSHPHVVQPIEQLSATYKDGSTGSAIVAYSLGNFVSNQRDRYQDSGILLQATLTKKTGATTERLISSLDYQPVYVRKWAVSGKKSYAILPVSENTAGSYSLSSSERSRVLQVKEELSELITKPQTPLELPADNSIKVRKAQ